VEHTVREFGHHFDGGLLRLRGGGAVRHMVMLRPPPRACATRAP
jgi:hypothetical protein